MRLSAAAILVLAAATFTVMFRSDFEAICYRNK